MPKFRKKPVVVEAFQMTLANWRAVHDWPAWLLAAWRKNRGSPGSFYFKREGWETDDGGSPYLATLEGQHQVTWDDWIIRGVQGELYPCKPDVFALTYEEVEEKP